VSSYHLSRCASTANRVRNSVANARTWSLCSGESFEYEMKTYGEETGGLSFEVIP